MDRYNAEGYPDPTAAEALENIMREEKAKNYKPCVFICSPFAGDIEKNLNKAREYLKFAVKQELKSDILNKSSDSNFDTSKERCRLITIVFWDIPKMKTSGLSLFLKKQRLLSVYTGNTLMEQVYCRLRVVLKQMVF